MGKFPKSILRIILVITLLNIVVVDVVALTYPQPRRDEKTEDDYHGTKVKDPYRWMEVPGAERVDDFIEAQNDLTYNYLSDCKQRATFKQRLNELWNYPSYGRPEKRGGRYFYLAQQRGGEVLYVQETRDSKPRALIDPQENGVMTFPNMGVSRDGELVVYKEVVNVEGFPRVSGNLRILNVSSGGIFPDIIEDVRNPQIAWDAKGRGFFYFTNRITDRSSEEEEETPEPPPKIYIYYHRIGSSAADDVLAIDYADFIGEPVFADIETSEDGRFLMIRTRSFDGPRRTPNTNNTFYVANISKYENIGVTNKLQLIPAVTKRNSPFLKYVTNVGQLFYFRSRIENKNYRLVEVDLSNPSEENWRTVVEENPNYTLQAANAVDKDKLIVSYSSEKLNSFAELRYLQNGSLIRMFPLESGELLSFSGNIQDSEVLFRSTKLEGLPELHYFNAKDVKGPLKPLVNQASISSYDPSQFVSTVVSYPSNDGSNVEMILMHRKDLKRDGSAYAFIVEREFDLDFYFRVYFSYMKDFNAVVAFPHLEENGIGFRDSALEDFIGAADYLVEQGYASRSRIIARGQSTFGLFVAAAVNKRPELFGASLPSLVAFDMLRYEAFTNSSAGYGSSQNPENFKRTYSISPLHNIRAPANESIQYPAIFIPTSNEYPIPLAFKYVAELQNTLGKNPKQTNPFLLRVVPEPIYANDINIFARYHVERETDVRCFLEKTVGLSLYSEK